MSQHGLRQSGAWRKARARVLANATVFHICGGALDFNAPPRSPMSPTVDHVLPLAATKHYGEEIHRQMAFDPHNLRPAHQSCNSSRGAGRPARRTRKASRWTSRPW